MSQDQAITEAVGMLEDIGLKEYEARCFVALTRLSEGTASDISDISEVPRTRVYEAIEVLEARGLVEVQHSSPRQYRAVSIEEAARTLRQRNETRIDSLVTHLQQLEPPDDGPDVHPHQVWAMTGDAAIQARTGDIVADAESELVLLVVDEALLTDDLVEDLEDARDRGVTVIIGGATGDISEHLEAVLPGVRVFETDLDWLMGPESDDEVAISRLVLADRETLLVSSFYPGNRDSHSEQAIYANGLRNGMVVLLRRLIASGLLPTHDPAD